MTKSIVRCDWCLSHPISVEYHDKEWGAPVHDDRRLLEFLILDAAQAGLSWLTILKKRQNYRQAFVEYDAAKIARFTSTRIAKLMQDPGIVRNELKIHSAFTNARAYLKAQEEFGSFNNYVWRFVDGRTIQNNFTRTSAIPPQTRESLAMSKDMKSRGFAFCGPTICYAFMQAAGLVNDHLVDCFRHNQVKKNSIEK